MTSSLQVGARHAVAAAIVFAFAFVGLAEEAVFPYSETVGDLSSTADWGRDPIPGKDVTVKIGSAYKTQTVTATSDVEFGGLFWTADCSTTVFDMREELSGSPHRKVTFNGKIDASNNGYKNLWLKGGVWDLTEHNIQFLNGYAVGMYSTLHIGDGACVYNIERLGGGYGDKNLAVDIVGSGTVVTTKWVYVGNYQGSTTTFNVRDGAELVMSGANTLDIDHSFVTDRAGGHDNWLVVSNKARFVEQNNTAKNYIGQGGYNNGIKVFDGGVAAFPGESYAAYAGSSDANSVHGVRLLSQGMDSSLTFGAAYLGQAMPSGSDPSNGSYDNLVVARDGGEVSFAVIRLGGHDNGLVISNGTVRFTTEGLITQGSTNCYARLQGREPKIQSDGDKSCCTLSQGFKFIYDLPVEGYAGDFIPVDFKVWGQMDGTCEIVVNGIPEMREYLRDRGIRSKTMTLLKARKGLNADSGILAAAAARWQQALPEGATIEWNGNEIRLTVKRLPVGMMMLLR